jgi:glutathione peroxidase
MLKLLILSSLMMLWPAPSIYDFKVPSLDGKEINFADYKGKKLLIVNTASECGFTPQYADLQKLHTQYEKSLVIVGFPANNFGGQEPGSNDEIKTFCQKNYGVTFPMAEKVSVKGKDAHPVFKYLTQEAKKLGVNEPIKWNFTKFLLNENGKLIGVYDSKVNPLDEEITKHLN